MSHSRLETVAGFLILVFIVVLFIWLPSVISTIFPPAPTITNNTLHIRLDGYRLTCRWPSLFVRNGSSWREIVPLRESLPGFTSYYVDDRFVTPHWDCDISCRKTGDIPVALVEYVRAGEKAPPADYNFPAGWETSGLVPEYRSYPLKGEMKVEMTYFTDKNCREARNYSATFIN